MKSITLNHHMEAKEVLVLEVRVEKLNASNSHAFLQTAKALIQDQRKVVFDLAGVQFIDSLGLGALLSCHQSLKARQGSLHLCELSDTVSEVFKLMRLHQTFHIFNTRTAAVQGGGFESTSIEVLQS
jgi:anti-sigma B factor antagonist